MTISLNAAMRPRMRHILSVDVEDYFQVEAFAGSISRESWDRWEPRVVDNTLRVLDVFDRYESKATFFFLGWVAERFPSLVRQVHSRGHELACHSYWHRPIYSLTPAEFREDTRRARKVIEDASGVPIRGYRAPTWSITRDSLWALDILIEEGFLYDSSIYPIRHDLYGMPEALRFPYVLKVRNGYSLKEFPPTTIRLAGMNFPAAGGGYLRILPFSYTRWVFDRFEHKYHERVVVYFHPWEIDPKQPRLSDKLRSRLRHYTNLEKMNQRLSELLRDFSFQPFRDIVAAEGQVPDPGARVEPSSIDEARSWRCSHA